MLNSSDFFSMQSWIDLSGKIWFRKTLISPVIGVYFSYFEIAKGQWWIKFSECKCIGVGGFLPARSPFLLPPLSLLPLHFTELPIFLHSKIWLDRVKMEREQVKSLMNVNRACEICSRTVVEILKNGGRFSTCWKQTEVERRYNTT